MKKVLLIATLLVSGFSAQAQVDTLTEFFTGTPVLYNANGGGYIAGKNTFGDKGKFQRFDTSTGLNVNGTMTGALLWIPVKDDAGGSIDVTVYDFAGGMAGSQLASETVTIASIDTALAAVQIAENAVAYNVAVTFASPIALTSGSDVVVGIEFSNSSADTIGLVSNTQGDVANGATHTWEIWNDDSWNSMGTSWNGGMLEIAMAIFPIVDGVPAGLNEATINASVYPNPAQSELNISLDGEANNVSVLTMDGKQVLSQAINGTSTSINVAELKAGVYIYLIEAADGSFIRDTFVKE